MRRTASYSQQRQLALSLASWCIAGCTMMGDPSPAVRQTPWSPAAGISGVRLETDHYDLRITATDPALRDVLPVFLETTMADYQRLVPPPAGRRDKLDTYLFETRDQWAAFTRRFVPHRAHVYLYIKAGGYVDPATATAVIWDLGRDNTLTLLAHEGFHQYLAKYFPEPAVPWLNEGLATQWESFDLKGGRPVFTPRFNYHRRNSLREALTGPEGWIPIRKLLAMTAGEAVVQTGQVSRGFYAQAWSLVLFLREGGDHTYTRGFEHLLADVGTERLLAGVRADLARSASAAQASYGELIFRRYITGDLDAFERAYRDFCEKLVG